MEEILPGFDVIPTATIAWFLSELMWWAWLWNLGGPGQPAPALARALHAVTYYRSSLGLSSLILPLAPPPPQQPTARWGKT